MTAKQIENIRSSIEKNGSYSWDLVDGLDELEERNADDSKIAQFKHAVEQGYIEDEDWKGVHHAKWWLCLGIADLKIDTATRRKPPQSTSCTKKENRHYC